MKNAISVKYLVDLVKEIRDKEHLDNFVLGKFVSVWSVHPVFGHTTLLMKNELELRDVLYYVFYFEYK